MYGSLSGCLTRAIYSVFRTLCQAGLLKILPDRKRVIPGCASGLTVFRDLITEGNEGNEGLGAFTTDGETREKPPLKAPLCEVDSLRCPRISECGGKEVKGARHRLWRRSEHRMISKAASPSAPPPSRTLPPHSIAFVPFVCFCWQIQASGIAACRRITSRFRRRSASSGRPPQWPSG